MKKVLLMFVTLSTVAVFAQSRAVESAAIDLRNLDMESAKKNIDDASINDQTKNDPKTWFFRASIYDTLYRNPAYAALFGNDGVEQFVISCKKCIETDTKKRYNYYCDFAIVNSGFAAYNKAIEFYQAKDAANASKFFQYVLDVVPLDKNNDLKKNNITEKNILLTMADLPIRTINENEMAVQAEKEGVKPLTESEKAALRNQAKPNLQKLINMDYQDPIIYLLMGNLYLADKDTTKALSFIEQGRGKFQTDKDLINMELNVYLAQGRQDVLLTKLSDALAITPDNETLLFVRGNVYDNFASVANKRYKNAKDTAATLSKKAKSAAPPVKAKLDASAKRYNQIADSAYKQNKEYAGLAEADYLKVVELKEDYIDAYYNLGALTNNKTTEIVEKMNAINAPTQAEYDKKFNVYKKEQDAILNTALGYFKKALEFAEALPETEAAKKKEKNATMVSILYSMQQVYANLGDEKMTMETKKRRTELEE